MLYRPPEPRKYTFLDIVSFGVGVFVRPFGAAAVDGGHARQLRVGRPERDVLHAERIEDARAEEPIERHARGDLDHAAQRLEAGAGAVGPARARLELERRAAQARNVVGQRLAFLARHLLDVAVAHRAAAEARHVRQQILDRDLALRGHGVELRRRLGAAAGAPAPRPPAPAARRRPSCRGTRECSATPDRSAAACLPRPCIMMPTPMTGLVIEAMRNMLAGVIGCFDSRSITPCALTYATRPLRATATTAPARSPAAMRRWIICATRCSRSDESPTSSGLPTVVAVPTGRAPTGRRSSAGPQGHVVPARVAEDHAVGVLGPDVLREPADHDHELALVVDAPADRQQRDRVVRPEHGRRGLQEQQRFLGHGHAQLGGVRLVVLAHADELGGQHRREQVQRRRARAPRPSAADPRRTCPASTRTVSSPVSSDARRDAVAVTEAQESHDARGYTVVPPAKVAPTWRQ